MDECKRGFYWTKKAWYSKRSMLEHHKHEVMFGLYCEDGGTNGEAAMHWVDLGTYGLAARLEAFQDSWEMLASMPDLVAKLGELNGKRVTEEQFIETLLELGFEDITPYDDPYAAKE